MSSSVSSRWQQHRLREQKKKWLSIFRSSVLPAVMLIDSPVENRCSHAVAAPAREYSKTKDTYLPNA